MTTGKWVAICSQGRAFSCEQIPNFVMNAKNRIKIVKRAEHGNEQAQAAQAQPTEAQPNATKRVARQVATWVKEFQQRRVEERARSFESLFQRA